MKAGSCRISFRLNKAAITVMLQITAWGVYKIFRAGGRGVLSREVFISSNKK